LLAVLVETNEVGLLIGMVGLFAVKVVDAVFGVGLLHECILGINLAVFIKLVGY
jgi:hypothetical protein